MNLESGELVVSILIGNSVTDLCETTHALLKCFHFSVQMSVMHRWKTNKKWAIFICVVYVSVI